MRSNRPPPPRPGPPAGLPVPPSVATSSGRGPGSASVIVSPLPPPPKPLDAPRPLPVMHSPAFMRERRGGQQPLQQPATSSSSDADSTALAERIGADQFDGNALEWALRKCVRRGCGGGGLPCGCLPGLPDC
jgi:hypothetical protein